MSTPHPGFEGYTRSEETRSELLQAIQKALEVFPNMRLGQLLCSAIELHHGLNFEDLFNVYDETVILSINDYVKTYGTKPDS